MSRLGLLITVLTSAVTTLSNILLTRGVRAEGGFKGDLLAALIRFAQNPSFMLGLCFYALAALLWFRIISTEPVNVAYPILVSLTFVFVVVSSTLIFGEGLALRKALGIAIIIAGIYVVSSA